MYLLSGDVVALTGLL